MMYPRMKRMYHVDIDKKSMTVSSHFVHLEGGAYYHNQRCGGRAYQLVACSGAEKKLKIKDSKIALSRRLILYS